MQAKSGYLQEDIQEKGAETEDFIKFSSEELLEEQESLSKRADLRQKSRLYLNSAIGEVSYYQERLYAPWMSKTTSQIKNPNVKLHNEIIEFSNYVQPSEKDIENRQKAIEQYGLAHQDLKSS
jgi:DNA polymerase sigma